VTVDYVIIGLGAVTGLAMGGITSLVGLPPSVEPGVWFAFYAVWLVAVHRRRSPSPFATVVLASLASGVVVGGVQVALLPQYIEANPWYAEYMGGTQASLAGQMMVQALGMGMLFGVAVGLLARGVDARRRKVEDA